MPDLTTTKGVKKPKGYAPGPACNCGHARYWHEEYRHVCRYPGGCRCACVRYRRRKFHA